MINIYKISYILILILLVTFPIFELHLVLFFLTTSLFLFDKNPKLPKKFFNLIFILLLITFVGIITSFFHQRTFYNWLKDFMYFIKPIIALLSGFIIAKKINNFYYILKGIIIVATIISIFHLSKVFWHADFNHWTITDIRRIGGISNLIESLALVLILGSYKYSFLNVFKNKLLKNTLLLLLSFSFIAYFSRTMMVAFIIFYLAILGYLKLSQKGIKYGFILLVSVGLFYTYLFSVKIERDKPGLESFLYKLKIAPSEIFIPKTNINVNNHASLWDHWRAYEASTALEQMQKNPSSFFMGKGFGALVDLKFDAPLNSEKIRFIPILHNGYVYILFKTGIVGLVLYFIFLLGLYYNSYPKENNLSKFVVGNLISGIGLYYLFSSLIITGIYNMHDIFAFILGILFFQQTSFTNKLSLKNNENRNNWN